ncbi:SDR family oxidoreductase [Streptomyces albidoflavus]
MTTTTGTSSRQPLTVVTGAAPARRPAAGAPPAAHGHLLEVGNRAARAAAEAVAERVRAAGRRALAVAVDTADAASVDALFDEAATLGTVTGLVNNAGMSGPVGRLADADPAGLSRALDVNVLGYLLCARRAVRDLAASGGGALVNISSAAATLGSPGEYVHYAAAKAAVDTLTVGLAKEVAEDGIRVNCVAPGVIWTEFHADPERPAKQAPGIPLGRAGQPEEIAAAVSWLLTADASYTTGAVLRVAGGR